MILPNGMFIFNTHSQLLTLVYHIPGILIYSNKTLQIELKGKTLYWYKLFSTE